MKTIKKLFKAIAIIALLLGSNQMIAQTNTGPQTVCAGSLAEPYLIPATTQNATSIFNWTISSGGTIISGQGTNQIAIDWSAIPGGPHTITVVETDVNGCLGNPVIVDVTIADAATANAGIDDNVCEGNSYTVSGATATNYSSISWLSSGTGTFSSGATLTPIYTPSAADIASGSVTLTLSALGNSPCSDATNSFILTIIPLPTANAGVDDNICEGLTFSPTGTSTTNNSSVNWTSSGAGTFTSGATLTPIYTPSAADIASGSVTLTLTALGNSPCGSVIDNMILTIIPAAIANAGIDDNVCEGSSYTVSAATATNYSSISWASSGTGTFTSGATLTPIYTPSPADISSGSVTLSMTILGNFPCASDISSMLLTIVSAPVSDAGADDYTCEGIDYTFSSGYATTLNSTSVSWTTTGDGTFTNGTSLTPTYIPGPNDILNGTVDLTLVSVGNSPCSTGIDVMTLIINPTPTTGPIFHN